MGVVMHIMDDKLPVIGGWYSPRCRFKRLELFCLFRRKAFGVKGPLIQSKNPHLCCKSGDDNNNYNLYGNDGGGHGGSTKIQDKVCVVLFLPFFFPSRKVSFANKRTIDGEW